jgi:CBS domain-containing protein/FixJ family two-component response regulator
MQNPTIMLVHADPTLLERLERDLYTRYHEQYQFAQAPTGEAALAIVNDLKRRNEQIALLCADQRLPGLSGVEFLVAARNIYPEAGRVLLTTHADAAAAIVSVNAVGIDRYLVTPWEPAAERLYPTIDDILDDWRSRARLPYMQVKRIMDTRVARIRHSDSLHRAAEIVALSGVGDLMVVDDRGAFIGVLSEGDILRNALPDIDDILEAGGTVYDAFQLFVRKGRELSDKPIMPLVIRDPIALHPDDHVAKAATVLIERQIRRLPVVQDGQLIGTISRANICQAVVGTFYSAEQMS